MAHSILVIDPELDVVDGVRSALAGYEFEVVESERELITASKRRRWDLILLDLEPPSLQASQILRRVLLSPHTNDVPVLHVSKESATVLESRGWDLARVVPAEDWGSLATRVEALLSRVVALKAMEEAWESTRSGLTTAEQETLALGGVPADALFDPAPLAIREAEHARIIKESLTTAEAAMRLGVDASRIRQRLGKATLYGTRAGRSWHLPAFQFTEADLVPGIGNVVQRVPKSLDVVAVVRWFTSPNVDLESDAGALSPVQWLSSGRPWQPVAEIAEDL